jgi:RNA polymerase sigma-B factor
MGLEIIEGPPSLPGAGQQSTARQEHVPPAPAEDRATRAREDRRLLTQYHESGDAAARDALVERFLPLARQLARRYQRGGEPLDDLVQVASLGLLKAIDRFDPQRETAFSSFAVPTILGELKRHFRDRTWTIHVSRSVQESIARVEKATEALRQELGRFPSAREVADRCRMTVEEVTETRLAENASRLSSLDAPTTRENDGDLADQLGRVDSSLDRVEDAVWIEQLAGELSPREREVLRLRFVEDLVQREIAERVGVSQMHVSRILRDALTHLADAA